MKNIVFIFLIASSSLFFSQESDNLFSNPHFSIHSGLSIISVKDGWAAMLVEGKTNLSNDVLLKLSVGYTNLTSKRNREVKSFTYTKNMHSAGYNAVKYKVEDIDYEIIPLSVGFQYNIAHKNISPYIFADIGFNLISSVAHKSDFNIVDNYESFGDLPIEYWNPYYLPDYSYKYGIGFGFNYQLTSVYSLDVRYINQIDTEITNSQQILVGIQF